MKKLSHYILLCIILQFVFTNCDVHEFPKEDQERIPFVLNLKFKKDMPLGKEITITNQTRTRALATTDNDYVMRCIVNLYEINSEGVRGEIDTTFIFTTSDINTLDYVANLALREGTYDCRVWADYVDKENDDDKYYDTRDFSEIIFANKDNYIGSCEYRDAFKGSTTFTVNNPARYLGSAIDSINNSASIDLERPMGKFKFVSTDVDKFIDNLAETMKKQGLLQSANENDTTSLREQFLRSIDLEEFTVLFRYVGFMPCSFNMFTDKPADSWTGMSFTSKMYIDKEGELVLGYDYIFVNGSETTLSILLEIYNCDNVLISSSNPIDVPIERNKLTKVKGNFLTTKREGGIIINPSYDGDDYNIEIY